MSIENGIPTLPHSSGVLCVLKGYAASLRKILKIVQSLVGLEADRNHPSCRLKGYRYSGELIGIRWQFPYDSLFNHTPLLLKGS